MARIPPNKIGDGEFLVNALLSGKEGRSAAFKQLQRDQSDALIEDIRKLPGEVGELSGTYGYVRIEDRAPIRDYEGDIAPLVQRMPFGASAQFLRGCNGSKLAEVAQQVFNKLISVSPRGPTGNYRRSHSIWVNGKPFAPQTIKSCGGPVQIIHITSSVNYAGSLEKPGWAQPYRKTFTWARRRFAGDAAFRLRFTNTRLGIPGAALDYNVPILYISEIGVMDGDTVPFQGARRRGGRKPGFPFRRRSKR